MDAAEIHTRELTISAAGRRMERGLEQLKSLRLAVREPLPVADAIGSLDWIDDDFDGIEKKLKAALAILDAETARIETLWEQPA